MTEIVQHIPTFTSAKDFLEALSPINGHFVTSEFDQGWLFRGQGADWPLIPFAFREKGKKGLRDLVPSELTEHEHWWKAERDILTQFFAIADARGLPLPDDSQLLRSAIETLNSERGTQIGSQFGFVEQDWDFADHALSLMCLAQHYQVPTRLLDWSRKAWIAAFFAAESAHKAAKNDRKKEDEESHLIVWALWFPDIGRQDVAKDNALRIVTAPSATNDNLKAQQGVFTLINQSKSRVSENSYPSLDSFLMSNKDDRLIGRCKLTKLMLPSSEAKELLLLLSKLDITASSVYPGYGSIIEDLRMQCVWTNTQPS